MMQHLQFHLQSLLTPKEQIIFDVCLPAKETISSVSFI